MRVEPRVGLGDPVVTLQGFCPDASASGESCTTVITRAQFEKLTTALDPGMPASLRLVVANALARNLRMASAAEKRGLDKTPQRRDPTPYRSESPEEREPMRRRWREAPETHKQATRAEGVVEGWAPASQARPRRQSASNRPTRRLIGIEAASAGGLSPCPRPMDSIDDYDWSAFPTHLNIPATREGESINGYADKTHCR
jgi:hypothetical protein